MNHTITFLIVCMAVTYGVGKILSDRGKKIIMSSGSEENLAELASPVIMIGFYVLNISTILLFSAGGLFFYGSNYGYSNSYLTMGMLIYKCGGQMIVLGLSSLIVSFLIARYARLSQVK